MGIFAEILFRMRRKQELPILENLLITDAGAEGKAVARYENLVVFVSYGVPGDRVDVKLTKKKKTYAEGRILNIVEYSPLRTFPPCKHFGLCGGCRWQNMRYEVQLAYKQKQVKDNLQRLGGFDFPEPTAIVGADKIFHYRNKVEFTFSNRKWLTQPGEMVEEAEMNGLGFHLPGMFDRILDIDACYLFEAPANEIRNSLRDFSKKRGFTFYNPRLHDGFMRNLIIRSASTGDLMIIMIFGHDNVEDIRDTMEFLKTSFPQITSLQYVINTKLNDSISDLKCIVYHGLPYITETLSDLSFRIGPLSFFQTNTEQALKLYELTRQFAKLTGNELVYDLYTGTGTIANYVAKQAGHVVGIEYIESAVEDARINSGINGIQNTSFFAGDMAKILTPDFIAENGKPDVIITDPPRAGMHPAVVSQIEMTRPARIVYVSCNPSTQARDIALLDGSYKVTAVQPVDMFPHTQHVENIVLLELR